MPNRRHFLRQAGAFAIGVSGLHAFVGCPSTAHNQAPEVGFGPLTADPKGGDLPEGGSYTVRRSFGRAQFAGVPLSVVQYDRTGAVQGAFAQRTR